ncbi:MAG: Holliday junction DNA helicase RuvB [Candidatus Yanofskybacteria bacterium RIFCSPLOWO2_01_FULL_49_25]|uniref:Holliday junction branch migration complex subunit RuvB n=1 Tax=Candidatus Yanofskybacteria bacterium RIFCSPLOWO2_01_FULL_49_25 TaxID=1802701 RepID=A0A1F8GTH7_9BACT|nr:MAG: Holliday junction DNA helicase RuvB [Candidatus Yanofskybacteria bacterium RIFCSPLOWO2_01_FULL_49_25]
MNVNPTKTPPKRDPDDTDLDLALRPGRFDDYIGQEQIKKNLAILVGAAKKRKEPLEHILIHGPSGLGKTTLAYIVAKEFGAGIRITSGTALEKAGDIGSILTGLSDGDFLFIDEVHRLNKSVEETLYPAMENYQLDIIIGKGASAKTLQLKLPRFTLIAATTRISLLTNPFRSRFGVQYKLDFYTADEIKEILRRSAKLLNIKTTDAALDIIAKSSRFTPRIANRLLKRVRDYAQVKNHATISEAPATEALAMLGIDALGLEDTDRKILKVIAEQFNGGPAGLKSIAASIGEEEETVEEVYEPYLMRLGFLTRTARGRLVTDLALQHLGFPSGKPQNTLL